MMNNTNRRTEVPVYLFHQGTNHKAYELLGTKPSRRKGVTGVVFRVWAPHAQSVSVVGDFNQWEAAANPMEKISGQGLWECFIPGIKQYALYKYCIVTSDGRQVLKADPYAYHMETRPETASMYYDISKFNWKDRRWMEGRKLKNHLASPINIYEVHLGSWKKIRGRQLF